MIRSPNPLAVHFSWEDGPLHEDDRWSDSDDRSSTTMPASPTACGPRARPPRRSRRARAAPAPRSTARCRSLMISRSPRSDNPEEYAELLEESGVKAQARAPMTPIVKLVFGIDYDKARLTEFAAALSYAQRQQHRARRFPGLHRKAAGRTQGAGRGRAPGAPARTEAGHQGRGCPRAASRGAPTISLADVSGGRGVRGRRHPPRRRRHATSRSRSSRTKRWSNARSAAPPKRSYRSQPGLSLRGARVYRPAEPLSPRSRIFP